MDRSILFVDSDKKSQQKFSNHLEDKERLSMKAAETVEEAISLLDSFQFKSIVMEAELPDGSIHDILDAAGDQNNEPAPVLFTSKNFDDMPTEDMVSFSAYVSKTNKGAYEKVVSELDSLLESQANIDYPIPENEEERLNYIEKFDVEALAESGDFDRLCKLGAELFDVEWCFVGIVTDERERFLSFEGSDTEELERSCTICTFAINQDDVMVVEDRKKDPRFKYVDELEDLGINWYAGAPLVTKEGYHLGSFCVADTKKKEFSEDEREMLRLLANEAMEKVKLKNKASETLVDKLRDIL